MGGAQDASEILCIAGRLEREHSTSDTSATDVRDAMFFLYNLALKAEMEKMKEKTKTSASMPGESKEI